ncbi:nuclear transport factor 2 family protein [Alteromonas flava]|uniref:nuclear transport factor 2 family protein n=1 Tax=Alteromonas flava TaxID=2048003 RepID=UPI001F0BB2B1|nr:nuclear transport factor 2 family protein [Alteromonas flava]
MENPSENFFVEAIDKFCNFYQQLNSRDISGLADVYADNIEFIDPIATHNGISAVQNYFAKLLSGTRSCDFSILSVDRVDQNHYFVTWVMQFESIKLSGKVIRVEGLSQLKTDETHVIYHRDYYDMGELVYEHIPIIGYWIKKIKRQLK